MNKYINHSKSSQRIYALDSYRVILLLLGFILHGLLFTLAMRNPTAAAKILNSLLNPLATNNMWRGLLMALIHSFRMPAFFILGGFFARFLLQRKYNAQQFMLNRFKRLVVPLLCLLLWVNFSTLTSWVAMLLAAKSSAFHLASNLHSITYIWFLWYLFLMEVVYALQYTTQIGMPTGKASYILPVLSVVVLLLYPQREFVAATTHAWLPFMVHFIYFYCFFLFGTSLAANKGLAKFTKADINWLYVPAAVAVVTAYMYMLYLQPRGAGWTMLASVLHAGSAWLLSLMLLMFAASFANIKSKAIRYFAEASYFLYLAEIPLMILLMAVIYKLHLSLLAVIVILIFGSLFVGIILYQLLVRRRKWLTYIDGAKPVSK